jgi:hypothetical protein
MCGWDDGMNNKKTRWHTVKCSRPFCENRFATDQWDELIFCSPECKKRFEDEAEFFAEMCAKRG